MWSSISTAPENLSVMTRIDDEKGCRNEQIMVRSSNMWFTGDVYVYYQPTHWRELTEIEKLRLKNEAEKRAIDTLERANKTLGL